MVGKHTTPKFRLEQKTPCALEPVSQYTAVSPYSLNVDFLKSPEFKTVFDSVDVNLFPVRSSSCGAMFCESESTNIVSEPNIESGHGKFNFKLKQNVAAGWTYKGVFKCSTMYDSFAAYVDITQKPPLTCDVTTASID